MAFSGQDPCFLHKGSLETGIVPYGDLTALVVEIKETDRPIYPHEASKGQLRSICYRSFLIINLWTVFCWPRSFCLPFVGDGDEVSMLVGPEAIRHHSEVAVFFGMPFLPFLVAWCCLHSIFVPCELYFVLFAVIPCSHFCVHGTGPAHQLVLALMTHSMDNSGINNS